VILILIGIAVVAHFTNLIDRNQNPIIPSQTPSHITVFQVTEQSVSPDNINTQNSNFWFQKGFALYKLNKTD